MEQLLLITLFLALYSEGEMVAEKMGFIKPGSCIDSRNLGYTIIQKIDDHHYELRGEGTLFEPHAILETKQAIYDSTGHPIGISMQRVGQKDMKLANGFSAIYQLWKECSFDSTIDCLPRDHNPMLAWPRLRKSISCTNKSSFLSQAGSKTKQGTKKEDFNSCTDECYEKYLDKKKEVQDCYRECSRKYKP